MTGGAGHHHRSGPLKQQNKTHKQGKHRSKGQLDNEFKGRVAKGAGGIRAKAEASKQDRKNRAKQIRETKRAEAMQQHRVVGGLTGAPQVVALVGLCAGADLRAARALVVRACMEGAEDDVRAALEACVDADGPVTVLAQRLKNRLTLIEAPSMHDLMGLLELAKACDTMVFVMRSDEAPTEAGEIALSAVKAMGLPAPLVLVQGMEEVPHKRRADVRKALMKYLAVHFPSEDKFFPADTEQDGNAVLRHLVNRRREGAAWRSIRPYVIADGVNWASRDEASGTGTLAVTGYIRGGKLDVNKLVHLPGSGDFQLERIDAARDPHAPSRRRHKAGEAEMGEAETAVLAQADPARQEDLVAAVEPDMLDQEQTFPTEDELRAADEAFHAQRRTVRVPKGTSAYQAAWIVEDALSGTDDDFTDVDEDTDDGMDMSGVNDDARSYAGSDFGMAVSGDEGGESAGEDGEEYEDLALEGEADKYDKAQEYDDEAAELRRLRAARAQEDLEFPDEIDTPIDQPARVRFQKFRGLQSFRTSPWDPKENLPLDYARIFQFEDFARTAKRVVKEARKNAAAVEAGSYVTMYIRDVPLTYTETRRSDVPLVVVGLLQYEGKMSIVNYALKRHAASEDLVVNNKEELVYVTPIRTFTAGTVLSQHTRNDKHKMERFFHIARPTVATVFAPIHFGAMPTIVFHKGADGRLQLLATGTVHSVDPDRIVLKKYILTGHPFKINIKTATVRYMFFNRADIAWFKPVELFTKYGLRGHIKEPLGTHGHMKCSFNGKMKAQDTVCMSLYKRVFPKWSFAHYHHDIAAEARGAHEPQRTARTITDYMES